MTTTERLASECSVITTKNGTRSRAHTRLWCGVVLLVSTSISASLALSQSDKGKKPPAHIVWSEPNEKGAHVYYAGQSEDDWTPPEKISDGDHLDVAPCLVVIGASRRWVVWTRMHTPYRSDLMLRHFDGQQWLPAQRVETTTVANTGAMLVASPSANAPTQLSLLWSGFDGEDDEVYYSVSGAPFNDWTEPTRIAPDNAFPDIQPLVGLQDNGLPWVIWIGFNGMQYVNQSVTWLENGFSKPHLVNDKDPRLAQLAEVSASIPAWPAKISQPKSACMTTDSSVLPSLPLRFAGVDTPRKDRKTKPTKPIE